MVEADLRGSDTHGVIRLPLYLRRLKAGGVNPRPFVADQRLARLLTAAAHDLQHMRGEGLAAAAAPAVAKNRRRSIPWSPITPPPRIAPS